MFNHGHHPVIGSMPIGSIEELREDTRGLFVRARLFDNWMIEPLTQAIREKAVSGMSFGFEVPEGKETWSKDKSSARSTK
jgi:HK97 family phage prohead protease